MRKCGDYLGVYDLDTLDFCWVSPKRFVELDPTNNSLYGGDTPKQFIVLSPGKILTFASKGKVSAMGITSLVPFGTHKGSCIPCYEFVFVSVRDMLDKRTVVFTKNLVTGFLTPRFPLSVSPRDLLFMGLPIDVYSCCVDRGVIGFIGRLLQEVVLAYPTSITVSYPGTTLFGTLPELSHLVEKYIPEHLIPCADGKPPGKVKSSFVHQGDFCEDLFTDLPPTYDWSEVPEDYGALSCGTNNALLNVVLCYPMSVRDMDPNGLNITDYPSPIPRYVMDGYGLVDITRAFLSSVEESREVTSDV